MFQFIRSLYGSPLPFNLSRWGVLSTHSWFREGNGGLVERVLSAAPPDLFMFRTYLSE